MIQEVLLVEYSGHLTKALVQNTNSQSFTVPSCLPGPPSSLLLVNGVWPLGTDGAFTTARIKIIPYAEAAPNSQFSFRVFGWDEPINQTQGPQGRMSIPRLLAEFACTVCNQPGIEGYVILASENFCDTISLTQGNLGDRGAIWSTGPGTNLIAQIVLDVAGSRWISFDFASGDTSNQITMNALWGRV